MLPRVLLSAHVLLSLRLDNIPNSGYISPEFFTTGLSVTTWLKFLRIFFPFPMSRSNQRSTTSSPSYAVLPALTDFQVRGDVDYLEDLITRIDAPPLERFAVTLFKQSSFNIPQLSQFISRAKPLRSPHQTSIKLSEAEITVTHDSRHSPPSPSSGNFELHVSYDDVDLQMPTLVHISRQLSALFASSERLDVADFVPWRDRSEADPVHWLEFFRLFPGVKRLEVSSAVASIVASTFEQITERSLPSLRELHMGGSRDSTSHSIERFAAAREHPVSVHYQSGEFDS
jgi:hypothetical protein